MTPQIELLRNRRTELRWSLEYTARRIGVSPITLYRWEDYRNAPNIYNYLNWAEALGIKFKRDTDEERRTYNREWMRRYRSNKQELKYVQTS